MLRRIAIALPIVLFASAILSVSVFRVANVKFDRNTGRPSSPNPESQTSKVKYDLPFAGKVLPDSPLWPLKAMRDKAWILITTNGTRRAELKLLFADKRVQMALTLFKKGKSEIALSTLTKAEKYLEEAKDQDFENKAKKIRSDEFLTQLAKSSLRHYELIIQMEEIAPENVKPSVIKIEDYSKKVFEYSRNTFLDKGMNPPENPFNW